MATSERVSQRAFVLHTIAYRETSLIVEVLTRDMGRVAVIAKGARRRQSAVRSALLPFQPIRITYVGRNELKTLTSAEWAGGMVAPDGDALICGFYMNELLLRLLPREDPHPQVFDAYGEALAALTGQGGQDAILRKFEWALLRESGYAPDLTEDGDGSRIDPKGHYQMDPGSGFLACEPGDPGAVTGRTLSGLSREGLGEASLRQEAKHLTRTIIAHHLNGAPLHSRQILIDLQKLS